MSEEENALRAELLELERLQTGLENAVSNAVTSLRKFKDVDDAVTRNDLLGMEIHNLVCQNAEATAEIEELHLQIALALKSGKSNGDDVEEDDAEEEREPILDRPDAEDEIQDGTKLGASRAVRRLCKALFKKIAARTHPDRTGDKDLHTLFMQAREFYNQHNLAMLEEIWDELAGGNIRRSRLKAMLQVLREKIEAAQRKLDGMMSAPIVGLLRTLRSHGAHMAAFEFRQMLRVTRDNMEHEKATEQIALNSRNLFIQDLRQKLARIKNGEEVSVSATPESALLDDDDDNYSLSYTGEKHTDDTYRKEAADELAKAESEA